MEDPDIVIDLREYNASGKDRFSVFWEKCSIFLSTCTSVHERRHDTSSFMARAISVRDLIEQVSKLCPADTPIPSESWVRLKFCPKNPRAKVSSQYRSRLEAKHMVQKRQFRASHPDAHFCAAVFRYMRDYAVRYRDQSVFVCLDDKHRVKVGEPNFPVAAVERGKEVIVSLHEKFVVADHDFCKFSLIPSVVLVIEIPRSIEDSWYRGEVFIGLKDAVFEPSSPIRHTTELFNILEKKCADRSILFVYTDGGPDHRLTFLTVQLSLIALFLKMNLDVLIAGRTAPSHSWANPVERVMAIVNLGLQTVGIMRSKSTDAVEKALEKCNSLKTIRANCSSFHNEIVQSLSPPKELIDDVLKRLELKGENFKVFQSASDDEISEFWKILLTIEKSLNRDDTSQASLSKYPLLQQFIGHCCTFRRYALTIKKCGNTECSICTPIKMNPEVFKGIHCLPDPILNEDGHFKSFEDVYGCATSENDCPSYKKTKKKSLSFNATQQHVKNVNLLVQCEECEMWRLLYSKRKLDPRCVNALEAIISDLTYTCGATFDDVELPSELQTVCIKFHECNEPMEKLYYSCNFPPVCYYCSTEDLSAIASDEHYPVCVNCLGKNQPLVKRPRKRCK